MMVGRCLCGDVRFTISGALGPSAFCHCTSCRRASGSAFAANALLPADAIAWQAGRERIREYESSPGKLRAFCGACGSPLYARQVAMPDWLSIRLGVLDGDPEVAPRAHFNVAGMPSWSAITDQLPQHAGDTEE